MPRTAVRINLEALRHLVIRDGSNAASLAAKCEPTLDRSTVSNILSGARKPSADSVDRLARALKVPMSAILADPNEDVDP